jgi:hypothetical protein
VQIHVFADADIMYNAHEWHRGNFPGLCDRVNGSGGLRRQFAGERRKKMDPAFPAA